MSVIENGKWQDKSGNFVHPDMVRIDKQIEDELVERLVGGALVVQTAMKEFKLNAFAECYAFVDLLRKEYDMERITSKVGAVTLKNFNGTMEVQIQVAKLITFDQKLALAKEKIDEYLTHKTENLDAEIQTLITRAFDVKNGNVNAKEIIGLKSYNITHPKWVEAMKMIDEATEIAGTKSYIRFKQRSGLKLDGAMENIVLDLAGLPVEEKEIMDVRLFNAWLKELKEEYAKHNLPITNVEFMKKSYFDKGVGAFEAAGIEFGKLQEQEEV